MDNFSNKITCCICGKGIDGFGNNPYPVKRRNPLPEDSNRCCDKCNADIVLPIRIILWTNDIVVEREEPI